VIGKVVRGERPDGLIRYLFGPGRREEHTDPHIVAGWRHPAELEPPVRANGRRDFRKLTGLLSQPHAALGADKIARPVWHCVARAAPADRMLSDDEWADLACDILHRTGLSPYGQEDDGVRWVAVRHAPDHIHIVAMLARQDGSRPRFWNDYLRVREACQAAEARHGLIRTAPGDRTAPRRPTRGEAEKAVRQGRREAPRVTLRRAVATAAAAGASEAEFFAHLRRGGVLVRLRHSVQDPGQVTGYAVALPGDTSRLGEPIWFGGGKLAADFTLPKLRLRWPAQPARGSADGADRDRIWQTAIRAADHASGQLRSIADPAAAADAAWAASDLLHAAAAALNSAAVRQAADMYARAARQPFGTIPRPTRAGNDLRRAARLLSAAGFVGHNRLLAHSALIARLGALAESGAWMHSRERRYAQAEAARRAAVRLAMATAQPVGVRAGRANGVPEAAISFPASLGTPGHATQERRPQAARSPQHASSPKRRR
jgi:hypothetical protein